MSYLMDFLLFGCGVWVGIAIMCMLMVSRSADEDQ